MKREKVLTILFFILIIGDQSSGQEANKYANDVRVINEYDGIYGFPDDPIVFVGSSSIRRWVTIQEELGRYNVIRRGIGGATTDDIILFSKDLIFKYKPRQLFFYIGENDFTNRTNTPDSVFHNFVRLYRLVRSKLPNTPISYISLKPNPGQPEWTEYHKMTNVLVKDFLEGEPNTVFIDIFTPLYNKGKLRPELYIDDQVHLNVMGYKKIWSKKIRKHLKRHTRNRLF